MVAAWEIEIEIPRLPTQAMLCPAIVVVNAIAVTSVRAVIVVADSSDEQLDLMAFEGLRDDEINKATEAFTTMLLRDSSDAFAHMWLGQLAVRQGDLKRAEGEFQSAVAKVETRMAADDAAEQYAIKAKKAQMELSLLRVRERLAGLPATNSDQPSCSSDEALVVEPVQRVHWHDLGHKRFRDEFAVPRKPVIIKGMESIAEPYWSAAHLRKVCGALPAPLRQHDTSSTSWGGLAEMGSQRSFADHLDHLESGSAGNEFVFDWPLRTSTGCAALLDGLSVPSYFTDQTVSAYGPSLFAQGNGTKCGLHVDAKSTHFWQYVWSGRKRWRIFSPATWPRLFDAASWQRAFFRDARCSGLFGDSAVQAAGCNDDFGGAAIDAFDDDALRALAVGGAPLRVHEATLEAGEVLFVPADSPHQVVNEGLTLAVSMNYVDLTNRDEAMRARLADSAGARRCALSSVPLVIPTRSLPPSLTAQCTRSTALASTRGASTSPQAARAGTSGSECRGRAKRTASYEQLVRACKATSRARIQLFSSRGRPSLRGGGT